MSIEDLILCDLLISQSTACSIAGRITTESAPVEKDQVHAHLGRLKVDGLVECGVIKGTLLIWHLTDAGRAHAVHLKPGHVDFVLPNRPLIPTPIIP